MQFKLADLSRRDGYKLLTGLIVPRPIAFVTTRSAGGQINAAPFSYFNLMGSDPPVVVIGPGNHDGRPKDTARNIRETGAFVVNLVDEAIAEQMNLAATDFPYGMNELEAVGLTAAPSVAVDVPRIAEAPASLECREAATVRVGRSRIVIGEVLYLHVRDELVDPEKMYIDAEKLRAVGRMGGHGYARTSDLFQMQRLSYEVWQAEAAGGADVHVQDGEEEKRSRGGENRF